MKKVLYILLVFSSICSVARAQNNSGQSNVDKNMAAIQNCKELNIQLTQLFGKEFSLSNPAVIKQLKKNMQESDRSKCDVKVSTFVVQNLSNIKETQKNHTK